MGDAAAGGMPRAQPESSRAMVPDRGRRSVTGRLAGGDLPAHGAAGRTGVADRAGLVDARVPHAGPGGANADSGKNRRRPTPFLI